MNRSVSQLPIHHHSRHISRVINPAQDCSTNGSSVNEVKLHGQRQKLNHGDVLSLTKPAEARRMEMDGTVRHKAIFCKDIPLRRPYIGLSDGRYLQLRFVKWPLTGCVAGNSWI